MAGAHTATWLSYRRLDSAREHAGDAAYSRHILCDGINEPIVASAIRELEAAANRMLRITP